MRSNDAMRVLQGATLVVENMMREVGWTRCILYVRGENY
jgi:hypothetical protein